MKKFITIVLFLIPFLINGQNRVFYIDVHDLTTRKKTFSIDSVTLNGIMLIDSSNNQFVMQDATIINDSIAILTLFSHEKIYSIRIDWAYYQICTIGYTIRLKRKNGKLYYNFNSCTSLQVMGPVKIEKMKP